MEQRPSRDAPAPAEGRRGEHNEIEYRNVDEQGEYDERGSQTPGPGEPRADEGDSEA